MAWCSDFYLEEDEGLAEFSCPYCGRKYSISEWHTEYGEPMEGEFTIHCSCEKEFKLTTITIINYKAHKKE